MAPLVPPVLTDGDLVLRFRTEADGPRLIEAFRDPEIPRWTRVPSPYGEAEYAAFLEHSAQGVRAGTDLSLLIEREGRVIGAVGLHAIDRAAGYGEIGYWTAAEARGAGVCPRAVRLLAGWARVELGLTTIEIYVHPDNPPSQRAAVKAGFAPTGERRLPPRFPESETTPYVVFASVS